MNILVVVEHTRFKRKLAKEVGRLAANTWANITLLGHLPQFVPQFEEEEPAELQENIFRYREAICNSFPDESCPYPIKWSEKWQKKGQSLFITTDSGHKFLDLIVINHQKNLKVISLVRNKTIDLLILGDQSDYRSALVAGAMEAAGSVLVIKGTEDPQQIVCCLDHDQVSHNSLEMINQIITLYNAELKIVGFSDGGRNQSRIESCLQHLLNYYSKLKVTPWLELVDASIMVQFLIQEAQKNLVALQCSKKSIGSGFILGEKEIVLLKKAVFPVLLMY